MRLKITIWHDTNDGKHKTVFRREEPSDHINALWRMKNEIQQVV